MARGILTKGLRAIAATATFMSSPGWAQDVDLTRVCSWSSFEPSESGVSSDPEGYVGAVFDGRYIYFAPQGNSSGYDGEVLRFDTQGRFTDAASWNAFSPADHGLGTDPIGFMGAEFDGRYVYFVPFENSTERHGEFLRYDTTGDFETLASWAAYDPGANGVGVDPDGYWGGAFDGRYMYFSPYFNGTSYHGEVMRLDTTADFESAFSWTTFDAGLHGVGVEYGYSDPVFDGRYVYFAPNCTADTAHHGEVRRYDTTGPFTNASSWAAFDPGANGVGFDPDGYVQAVFDGQYVYFVPFTDEGGQHSEVLRFDTTGAFTDTSAWATFDPGDYGIGVDPTGFMGAVIDDRYLYFVPFYNRVSNHSEFLRYDRWGDFVDPASWTTFDPATLGITGMAAGFASGVWDGRYLYFSPYGWAMFHGLVLRYEATTCLGDFDDDGDVDLVDVDTFETCFTGPDAGPLAAGCEAGDFDGDTDIDCGDWRELVLSWAGPGEIPTLDLCPCAPPDPPQPEPQPLARNRYIALQGGNAGLATGLRVTFDTLPSPFDAWNGVQMYVGLPVRVCENSGQGLGTQAPDDCGSPGGDADPWFWAAPLKCDPGDMHVEDWSTYGVVNLYHEGIVPNGTYSIHSIGGTCSTAVEENYSLALQVVQTRWGDLCGPYDIDNTRWLPPDGTVDVSTDIVALIDKFTNQPGAPAKTRADLEPALADMILGISDVVVAIDAFRGFPYPFEPGMHPCSP